MCVCVWGVEEYSGGSDRQRAADREQVRRERVRVSGHGPPFAWPVHSTGVYESVAIGEESLSLQPNPGPPVDDSVLCGPLQGLFFYNEELLVVETARCT